MHSKNCTTGVTILKIDPYKIGHIHLHIKVDYIIHHGRPCKIIIKILVTFNL